MELQTPLEWDGDRTVGREGTESEGKGRTRTGVLPQLEDLRELLREPSLKPA